MLSARLTVIEVKRNFAEILGRVYFRGERCILVKGGRAVAELRPTVAAGPVRMAELSSLLDALPHLDPEDATRFARDLSCASADIVDDRDA